MQLQISVQKLPINKHNIVYGWYPMQNLSCWENGMGKWATVQSSMDHGVITKKYDWSKAKNMDVTDIYPKSKIW